MFCRKLLGGLVAGLTLASVAALQLGAVQAEERMQLGAPLGAVAEFQSQVGDRVFFSDASAELGSRGRLALEAQAAWLLRNRELSVVIEGHADDAGDIAHNIEVSQRRADAVRRRLIQMGVAPERIRIVAYGRERLGAPRRPGNPPIGSPSQLKGALPPLQSRVEEGPSCTRSLARAPFGQPAGRLKTGNLRAPQ
jgi:hypothetical protein